MSKHPPEPWHSFLTELDGHLVTAVQLHCLGGFAVTMMYGFHRPTADVDFLSMMPSDQMQPVLRLAGMGSPLHKKHGIYLQHVTEATTPESYADRLTEMFPSSYRKVRMFALDPYDLALSKLERNIERDRDDVKYLAGHVPLNLDTLKRRYQEEVRPYLVNETRHDLTMHLWIEMIEEVRRGR